MTASVPKLRHAPEAPVRLLHLHSGNILGGIESVLATMAQCNALCPELRQQFALTFDGEFASRLRRLGAHVHLLPQVRLRHIPSLCQSRRQFRRLLAENEFDTVVSHSPWIQLIFGDIVCDHGIPLVFWMHNDFDGHWLRKLASFHVPDLAICNSRWTCDSLDRSYPHTPRRVIYYPVLGRRYERSADLRSQLGAAPEDVVILIAARIDSWKGHRNLLRSLALVHTNIPWRLWIAGAPNLPEQTAFLESLRTEVQTLGLAANVRFLGARDDVPSLMASADIYCQPNELPEPFGVVFVETLQAGVPVVTFSMGGAREILNASTGILVAPGDLKSLAAALTKLMENADMRHRLGAGGPSRAVELCDPGKQMHLFYEALQPLVRRREARAS